MSDKFDLPSAGDGSENQDVCSFFASFINQRQSVERLLNWLRESQTTCTDSNCFDDINGLSGGEQGAIADNSDAYGETDPLTLVMLFVVGILTLYAMSLARDRNQSRHGSTEGKQNKSNNNQNRFRRNEDDDDHSRPAL